MLGGGGGRERRAKVTGGGGVAARGGWRSPVGEEEGRAARRPEKAERERCGRGSSGGEGCATSGLRERSSIGD